jgi:hypothetical protein
VPEDHDGVVVEVVDLGRRVGAQAVALTAGSTLGRFGGQVVLVGQDGQGLAGGVREGVIHRHRDAVVRPDLGPGSSSPVARGG